mmetsp:Transcript_146087/g.255068  ORF Transcript_146087/g.255068 Transcript_146087/m.255068 type:complete len:271 (-) Transcript_146087:1416-2228(-)
MLLPEPTGRALCHAPPCWVQRWRGQGIGLWTSEAPGWGVLLGWIWGVGWAGSRPPLHPRRNRLTGLGHGQSLGRILGSRAAHRLGTGADLVGKRNDDRHLGHLGEDRQLGRHAFEPGDRVVDFPGAVPLGPTTHARNPFATDDDDRVHGGNIELALLDGLGQLHRGADDDGRVVVDGGGVVGEAGAVDALGGDVEAGQEGGDVHVLRHNLVYLLLLGRDDQHAGPGIGGGVVHHQVHRGDDEGERRVHGHAKHMVLACHHALHETSLLGV